MKQIAVIPNTTQDIRYEGTRRVVQRIKAHGIVPLLSSVHENSGIDAVYLPQEQLRQADMLIVLGGDGTLLSAAREFFDTDIPIFGINHGHFGFLTEIEKQDEAALDAILEGDYSVARHKTLEAQIGDTKFQALNDAVIHRGTFSGMLKISVRIDGVNVTTFGADGIIVSTPTGSTAYAMSAGGPIIDPTVDVLLITPICPHDLYSRSIIVPADKEIILNILNADKREAILNFDGREGCKIENDRDIRITGSKKIQLVRKNDSSFYGKLKKKMFEKEL